MEQLWKKVEGHELTVASGVLACMLIVLAGAYGSNPGGQLAAATVSASNLSGKWLLDENTGTKANDTSGKNNAGTLVSGPTWTPGQKGSAIHFDGVNDRVEINDSASLDIKTDLTVALWVNLDTASYTTTSQNAKLLQKGQSSATNAYSLVYKHYSKTSSAPEFRVRIDGKQYTIGSGKAFQGKRWYHLAGVRDGRNMMLYVDGVLAKTVTNLPSTKSITTNNSKLYLGESVNDSNGALDGSLDDVRVYARALSASEIKTLMGENMPPVLPTVPGAANLLPVPNATSSLGAVNCLLFGNSNALPPSGYGAAWDVFNPSRLLLSTNCPTTGFNLQLTVGADDASQVVYQTAHVYENSVWKQVTLSGTTTEGWIRGKGMAAILAPESTSKVNPLYIAGYVCTDRAGSWKCGCSDASCTTSKWQLQAYTGLPTVCGNLMCEIGEDPTNCSLDCKPPAVCGNNMCEETETSASCPMDCQTAPSGGGEIIDVTFDNATKRREAYETDNWPVTWAPDDNLYASFGDGGGFGQTDNSGRVQLGFARITGDWSNYIGTNIWGGFNTENPAQFGGYDYALISIDGVFWAWPIGGTSNNELIKSTDFGQSWTRLGLTTTQIGQGMRVPSFVNMGKDYADRFDNYLYINGRNAGLRANLDAYMARVPIDKITDATAYETFTGFVNDQPTWSSNFASATPTYTGDVHWASNVVYIKGLNRFIMINNAGEENAQNSSVQSDIEFLEAPKPWGPWRHIKTFTDWMPPGSDAKNRYLFMFDIPGKWQSADGLDFTLVYTGTGTNDSWNTIRGHFTTN